jgi:hypothetical protein
MRRLAAAAILSAVCGGAGLAQNNQQVPKALEPFVKIDAPGVLIDHVRVIDGTGAPAKEDQVILIVNGKISMIGSAGQPRDQLMPANTKTIDGTGKTVFPGLVGRLRAAAVPRRGCDHGAHRGEPRTVHRYFREAAHRLRQHSRAEALPHGAVPRGIAGDWSAAAHAHGAG